MRSFPFVQVDVFSAAPLAGNGLVVFTDARGLTDAALQALARETRQAETTFVLPDPHAPIDAPVPVRIFTPSQELPFAGHPTLGTAAVLRGTSSRPVVTLALKVGDIPVRFEGEPGFGEMRQNDPTLGEVVPLEAVAAATGLATDALSTDVPAQKSSTGLPFVIVPVRRSATLQALAPERAAMKGLLAKLGVQGFYFLCREPASDGSFAQARMFDADSGEDPATGSAAGACTAWMVAHGVLGSEQRGVIAQGDAMLRPSRIHVRARREGARVTDVRVGGVVVEVARGSFALP